MTPIHPALLDLAKLIEEAQLRQKHRADTEEEYTRLGFYIEGLLHAAKVVAIHLSTEHMVQ